MNVGEEKDIDITFPKDYHKDLAGKAVVFHVKVNKLTMNIIPEQDDEFAKDVSEFDTLEALKADIRAKALEKAQKQLDSDFENAAVEKAAENTTVDMPNALVEKELDVQMERFGYQLQMSGYSMEQYAKMMGGDVNTMRNAFRPTAEKQAKISVTLEKIVEVEGLTVTDEEIIKAQLLLGRKEGVCVEPASAASVAGLKKLREQGVIDKDETVACICTGNGLKDPDTILANVPKPIPCQNSVKDVERILSEN